MGVNTGMKKKYKIVVYIICALLMAAYLVILASSQYPQVCIEYKLYYIEKELQDWPGTEDCFIDRDRGVVCCLCPKPDEKKGKLMECV